MKNQIENVMIGMIDEDCKECNGTGFHEIQIAEHILENQNIVDRLHKEIKNLPACFSKECMGCEIDMQRHILNKILEDQE